MSRTAEVLVVPRHTHTRVPPHLVTSTDVVTHLHLPLPALLVEILHLTVVGRVVVLAVVVMRRGIVAVGMPVEGVVALVLVGQRRIAGRRDRRRRRRYDAAGVAAEGRKVAVDLVVWHLWGLLLDIDDGRRDRRRRRNVGRRDHVRGVHDRRRFAGFCFRWGRGGASSGFVLLLLELLSAFRSSVFEPHLQQKSVVTNS